MSQTPILSRAEIRKNRKKRRVGFIAAGAILAAGAVAIAAPAVASSLTSHQKAMTPAITMAEAKSAIYDARIAMADAEAANAEVTTSGLTLQTEPVETTSLKTNLKKLASYTPNPAVVLPHRTETVESQTESTITATAELRADLAAEQQRIADEQAAAAAAAQAQAEAEAAAQAAAVEAAEVAAAANTPDGARETARSIALSDYGWGDGEFSCLDSLWTKESGWNYEAENPSGAYGIPQSLPGSKMSTVAEDWATNATTQITWGLKYIDDVYGSPCSAWGHSQSTNWY